jgi:hypothetical protein
MNAGLRTICVVSLAILSASCTIVYNQPASGTQASQQQPTQNNPQSNKADSQKPKNIAEAIEACRKLQNSREIPFSCGIEYIDNIPTMMVGFSDYPEMENWLTVFDEYISEPFCKSANQSNRQAVILVYLKSSGMGNLYSCETRSLSGWIDLNQAKQESKKNKNYKL